MKILATGLLCLCLTALTGCSTSSVVKVETVYLEPPAVLLRELEPPAPEIKTNLDLLNYAVELRYLVEELNADKRALKAYYESVK